MTVIKANPSGRTLNIPEIPAMKFFLFKKTVCFAFAAPLVALSALISTGTAVHATGNVWMAQVQESDTSFRIDDLTGPSGQQIRLKITLPPKAASDSNSVTFYGLPDKILLSTGVRKSKVWIVPANEAASLTLIAPNGYQGHFESAAILRQKNGQVIEGQRFVVSIQTQATVQKAPKEEVTETKTAARETEKEVSLPSKEEPPVSRETTELSPSQKAYTALSLRPAEKAEPEAKPKPKKSISDALEATLLEKGKQLLQEGNIVAARETLKFLAEQGNAESANIIAKTYDPEEFKTFKASGIEPDLEEAKKWYTIAARLGATEAQNRLKEYADAGL